MAARATAAEDEPQPDDSTAALWQQLAGLPPETGPPLNHRETAVIALSNSMSREQRRLLLQMVHSDEPVRWASEAKLEKYCEARDTQDWEAIDLHTCPNGNIIKMWRRRNVVGAFQFLLANPDVRVGHFKPRLIEDAAGRKVFSGLRSGS